MLEGKTSKSDEMELKNMEEFLRKYNELVNYIKDHSLIEQIEDSYKAIYSSELIDVAFMRVNNVMTRLFDGDNDKVHVFNEFMQNPGIDIANRSTDQSVINARLRKLRAVYSEFFLAYGLKLSEPFNIGFTAIAIQQNSPNMNLVLTRNDGAEFISTLNFNSAINLVNSLSDNLVKKIESGNNMINLQLIKNYAEISEKLQKSLDKFIKENVTR